MMFGQAGPLAAFRNVSREAPFRGSTMGALPMRRGARTRLREEAEVHRWGRGSARCGRKRIRGQRKNTGEKEYGVKEYEEYGVRTKNTGTKNTGSDEEYGVRNLFLDGRRAVR